MTLASLAILGCSGQGQDLVFSQTPRLSKEHGYVRGDYDEDDNGGDDYDDRKVRTYGHKATAADREAVERLIKRYYAAAAHGDGTTACSLMNAQLAHSQDFANRVPEAYVPATDSSILRGKNCTEITLLLFGPTHQQLTEDAATVKVADVRINNTRAVAILVFTKTPESELAVERAQDTWKVNQILSTPLA